MNEEINTGIKHFTFGNCLNSLSNIRNRHYNIAIYERSASINPMLIAFLKTLINIGFKDFKATTNSLEVGALLYKHFKEVNIMGLDLFINDIVELVKEFSQISKSKSIRVDLSFITNDQCRIFHTDIMDLRMLCTYYGEGTLWLENDNVNWKEYGCCNEDEKLVKDVSKINQISTFDVALFKGALYPDTSINAVLHRSPQIEKNKSERILLRLDTNAFINDLI
jgi:hypothetical protein